jgi:ribonuclease VapC
MIIDTSALVAILFREPHCEALTDSILAEGGFMPAPVLIEYHRVAVRVANEPDVDANLVIEGILRSGVRLVAFGEAEAQAAVAANRLYGSGNLRGGKLNMLDLMVYATAKLMNLPILCTGNDFPTTDALIHPASRVG